MAGRLRLVYGANSVRKRKSSELRGGGAGLAVRIRLAHLADSAKNELV
jgi:hypothetical protein